MQAPSLRSVESIGGIQRNLALTDDTVISSSSQITIDALFREFRGNIYDKSHIKALPNYLFYPIALL